MSSAFFLATATARDVRARSRAPEVGASYSGQVLASADDAYEDVADNSVTIVETQLRLGGYAGVAEPVVIAGLRFTGITLEPASLVQFAQLRFTAKFQNGESCLLRIWCEDADAPAAFAATSGNISGRTKTTAYVDWDVPPWEVGQNDADTRSPDLAAVVQEVVDRPGFAGTVVFIIELSPAEADFTFPRRRAWSYDGSSTDAAELTINTSEGGGGGPSPTGDFSDGSDLFGFEGNEAYDGTVLKDGTAISGSMQTYLLATEAWIDSPEASGDWRYTAINSIAANLDSYNVARDLEVVQTAYLSVFRLTGDLVILDKLVAAHDIIAGNFVEDWLSTTDYAAIDARSPMDSFDGYAGPTHPWSPYANKILYRGGGGDGWMNGTDLSYLNTHKLNALQIELAWVLHVNRGKTSPAGYNYATKADYWGAHVESLVDAYMQTPLSTSNWTTNYRMVTRLSDGAKVRAAVGAYPMFRSDEGHAAFNGIIAHRYLSLLGGTGLWDIPNPADALVASEFDADRYVEYGLHPCTGTYGDSLATLWTRPLGSVIDDRAQHATYTGYVAASCISMWLSGAFRTKFTRARLSDLANSIADMHNGTTGLTYNSIIGDADKCGLRTGGSARTPGQNSQRGFCNMLVFAEGGARTKLDTVADTIMTVTAGGYADPNSGVISAAQFVREALIAVGDLE